MRHFLRSSRTLVAFAAVLSCGASLIGASSAAGATFSETSDFPYSGTNICAGGEAFTGTGTLHMDVTDSLSAAGAIHYHLNSRLDGLKAVTVTGKRYVVQETYNHEFVFAGADEDTFDITAHYVRVGEDGTFVLGDDFYEYLRTHITTNALGVVTALDVRMSNQPCQ